MFLRVKMKTNAKRGYNNIYLVLCLSKCHTALKKPRKNVFKNLTKILMCPYRDDVAELIWIWHCLGYEAGFECYDGIRIPYMEKI